MKGRRKTLQGGSNPELKALLRNSSLLLAILAIFSSIVIIYLGYSINKKYFIENIFQTNFTSVRTINTFFNYLYEHGNKSLQLKEIEMFWKKGKPENSESCLDIFSSSGKILLDVSMSVPSHQLPFFLNRNLFKLFKDKKTWNGEITDIRGQPQLVSLIYNSNYDVIIGVHVKKEVINQNYDQNLIPWLMGFGFISFILLPVSLFLQNWAFVYSQKDFIKEHQKLLSSLEEKEILLKEIHHRVKNNLQIIYSLLGLQTKYVKDDIYLEMLRESQQRIKSMAIIHEKLYQSNDLSKIDFYDYINDLTGYLYETYRHNNNLKIEINVEKIFLDIDTAIPCGLIINELFSNTLKHAFPDNREGLIKVIFITENDYYLLCISDNGIGFSSDFNIRKSDSLGLKLVNSLVKQIRGNLEVISNNGLEFKITFRGCLKNFLPSKT